MRSRTRRPAYAALGSPPARRCAHGCGPCETTYCPTCGRGTVPAGCDFSGKPKAGQTDGWMVWKREEEG